MSKDGSSVVYFIILLLIVLAIILLVVFSKIWIPVAIFAAVLAVIWIIMAGTGHLRDD